MTPRLTTNEIAEIDTFCMRCMIPVSASVISVVFEDHRTVYKSGADTPLEKRLRSRPWGVRSKNRVGERRTASSISRKSIREARRLLKTAGNIVAARTSADVSSGVLSERAGETYERNIRMPK